ncbi:hypothetical protein C9374_000766 [Naegleria lovaniensis]|uniref:DNA repair metallo-beta-lactamase domain-containing protein n=1 Tax=Naegleria lovaniensis TaxID=51637 RepID=A0AA88GT60_NAELO|nr:uncharacterized protein C9374_000766 [Naegleria lovaniensis]KAG2387916.1 hypothetical protein C9374_000766 [Naegleria lovaniensis]
MASNDEDIKIIPGTEFVVDGFKYKHKYSTFFLTHFHSDHYAGLIKTWSHGIIFCTIPTCNLVKKQFTIADKYLRPCEFNKTYEHKNVKFTFLDANHCPGSSLILFQVQKTGKAFLHTGDMRFDRSKMLDCEELRPYMRDDILDMIEENNGGASSSTRPPKKFLDSIFIDTTYCDPYYTFPKQMEAIDFISDLITMKLNNKSKSYLILIGTYLIGKERIAEGISKKTGKKVFVTFEKYKTLECLALPYMNIFTMDISQTNIHIVNMKDIAWKRLFQIRASNKNVDEIIAIKPSAWCFKEMDIPTSMPLDGSIPEVPVKATRNSNITLIEVPYSEHSSFTELRDCVGTFNFTNLVPTVYKDPHHKARIIEMLADDFQYTPITVKFTLPEVVLTEKNVASSSSKSSTPKRAKKKEAPKRDDKQKPISLFFRAKKEVKPISTEGLDVVSTPSSSSTPSKQETPTLDLDDIDFDDLEEIMNDDDIVTESSTDGVSAQKLSVSDSPMTLSVTPLSNTSRSVPSLDIEPIDVDDDFRDGSQFAMLLESSPMTMDFSPICIDSQGDDDVVLNPIPKSSNPFLKNLKNSSQLSSKTSSASTTPSLNNQKTKLKLKRKSTPSGSSSETKKSKPSPNSSSSTSPQSSILSFFAPSSSKPITINEVVDESGNIILSIEDDDDVL